MSGDPHTDWQAVADAAASTPLPALLAEIGSLVVPRLAEIDIWLWDHQRSVISSLLTGRTMKPPDGPDPEGERASLTHRVPLVVQGESIGWLAASATEDGSDDEIMGVLETLGPLLASTIRANESTIDTIEIRRRSKEMSLPAEMQWALLPPEQFAVGEAVLSAAVEPAYETGGDVFDYALDGHRLRVAVLDAMGHGIRAAMLSTLAVGAMRRARRNGHDLVRTAVEMTESLRAMGRSNEYVTALLVDLDLRDWTVRWLTAGHLPPLIHDGGRARELPFDPALPLGMVMRGETSDPVVQKLRIEPGQSMVLHSDGITDNADSSTGASVGDERFRAALVEEMDRAGAGHRHLARRVVDRLLEFTGAAIRDDATLLVLHRSS